MNNHDNGLCADSLAALRAELETAKQERDKLATALLEQGHYIRMADEQLGQMRTRAEAADALAAIRAELETAKQERDALNEENASNSTDIISLVRQIAEQRTRAESAEAALASTRQERDEWKRQLDVADEEIAHLGECDVCRSLDHVMDCSAYRMIMLKRAQLSAPDGGCYHQFGICNCGSLGK